MQTMDARVNGVEGATEMVQQLQVGLRFLLKPFSLENTCALISFGKPALTLLNLLLCLLLHSKNIVWGRKYPPPI